MFCSQEEQFFILEKFLAINSKIILDKEFLQLFFDILNNSNSKKKTIPEKEFKQKLGLIVRKLELIKAQLMEPDQEETEIIQKIKSEPNSFNYPYEKITFKYKPLDSIIEEVY